MRNFSFCHNVLDPMQYNNILFVNSVSSAHLVHLLSYQNVPELTESSCKSVQVTCEPCKSDGQTDLDLSSSQKPTHTLSHAQTRIKYSQLTGNFVNPSLFVQQLCSRQHCGKRRSCSLSNFSVCHYVFKNPSAAEASESFSMRERVKE